MAKVNIQALVIDCLTLELLDFVLWVAFKKVGGENVKDFKVFFVRPLWLFLAVTSAHKQHP